VLHNVKWRQTKKNTRDLETGYQKWTLNGFHFHVSLLLLLRQRNPVRNWSGWWKRNSLETSGKHFKFSFTVYTLTSYLFKELLLSCYSPTPHIIRTVVPAPEGSRVPCGWTQTLVYRSRNSTSATSSHLCSCMWSFCLNCLQNEPSLIHHQVPLANRKHTRVTHFSL
jgi:hypothetical protein